VHEELLTVEEVADWLKVHQQSVRNWIDDGEIHAIRVGRRRVRIRRSEIERFIGIDAGAQEHTAATIEPDAAQQFRSTMLDAAAKLDAGPGDLASALFALADAARTLAVTLESEAREMEDASQRDSSILPADVEDRR
jgi:excisionase family DNA binding protein